MEPLPALGLWGDGDEIWAIEAAFAELDLPVPVEAAPDWITVGSIWNSAVRIAPALEANPTNWDKFRIALGVETGIEWTRVGQATTLFDRRGTT